MTDGNENKKRNGGLWRGMRDALFGAQVEFRAKLFNAVMVICGPGSFIASVSNYINGSVVDMISMAIMGVLCFGMLWYVTKTGRYQGCYIITIVAIYFVSIIMYYTLGGYECRAMDYVFYVAFTSIFLKGKLRIFFVLLWIISGAANIFIEYNYPHLVTRLERDVVFREVGFGVVVLSSTIAAIAIWFFNIYDRQAQELKESRREVEELSKMQTNLFARMSHEMRTPLSTMSVYAQLAANVFQTCRLTAKF